MKTTFPKLVFQDAFADAIKKIAKKPIKNQNSSTSVSAESEDILNETLDAPSQLEQFDIQSARMHIAECVIKGRLNASVLVGLQTKSGFLPVEGSLLDYKRDIPSTPYEYGKLVKQKANIEPSLMLKVFATLGQCLW